MIRIFSVYGKFPGYRRPGIICVGIYVDLKDMDNSRMWNYLGYGAIQGYGNIQGYVSYPGYGS